MLVDGEIVKKADISADDKFEITNISNYMYEMGYLDDMDWFPEQYAENYYGNFKKIYGFEQHYDRGLPGQDQTLYLYATLDENEKINIENYDIFFKINTNNKREPDEVISEFSLEGKNFVIKQVLDEKGYITITISDDINTLIEIPMKELIDGLFEKSNMSKEFMDKESLTIEKQNDKLKVKLLINHINVERYDPDNIYIYTDIYVFVTAQ